MRKHLATALPGMVVLNSYSHPFQRQNTATGVESNLVRWDFLFTCQDSCYAANGTESVPSIHDITGNNWYYNEKQSFGYCTSGIGALNAGKARERGKSKMGRYRYPYYNCDKLKLTANWGNKVIGIS